MPGHCPGTVSSIQCFIRQTNTNSLTKLSKHWKVYHHSPGRHISILSSDNPSRAYPKRAGYYPVGNSDWQGALIARNWIRGWWWCVCGAKGMHKNEPQSSATPWPKAYSRNDDKLHDISHFLPPMIFFIPRLSFGLKNILREGMSVFGITLLIIELSPHPTIEISDNHGLLQQFFSLHITIIC